MLLANRRAVEEKDDVTQLDDDDDDDELNAETRIDGRRNIIIIAAALAETCVMRLSSRPIDRREAQLYNLVQCKLMCRRLVFE